jgi:hypothetical protein
VQAAGCQNDYRCTALSAPVGASKGHAEQALGLGLRTRARLVPSRVYMYGLNLRSLDSRPPGDLPAKANQQSLTFMSGAGLQAAAGLRQAVMEPLSLLLR